MLETSPVLPLTVRLVQIAAALALLALLWRLFRMAMGLRYAKVAREEARAAEEARGRRVVAEIPDGDGLLLFLEDEAGFYWGAESARKRDVVGARLILNGGVLGAFHRAGTELPAPPVPEEFEGRERWEVLVYQADGSTRAVRCGTLREGVSREIAGRVFDAVRASTVP